MTKLKCTNCQRGTFNHECGRPAAWIGVRGSGFRQPFCDDCKRDGHEAPGVRRWERPRADDTGIEADTPLFDLTDAGRAYLEAHR